MHLPPRPADALHSASTEFSVAAARERTGDLGETAANPYWAAVQWRQRRAAFLQASPLRKSRPRVRRAGFVTRQISCDLDHSFRLQVKGLKAR